MSDIFSPAKRSEVMSRIRGRGNKSTEAALGTAFKDAGITGWRRHIQLKPKLAPADQPVDAPLRRVQVRPDFLFRSARVAVFVDGCFWHGCPKHQKKPSTNADFWAKKLQANVHRDQKSTRALENAGWRVLRVWEHELSDMACVISRIASALEEACAKD